MIIIREKKDFYNNFNYSILSIIITIIVNIIIFAWKKRMGYFSLRYYSKR